MKKLLSTQLDALANSHIAVLILRVGAGLLIISTHGIPKLLNVIQGNMDFMDPIGLGPGLSLVLAAFAEGICGTLIVLGLGTRIATIFLIINMSVIVLVVHAADPFGVKERPLLFLLMWVVLFFTGSGKYSLDQKLFNQPANTAAAS